MVFARRIQNPEGLYFITFATNGGVTRAVDVFNRTRALTPNYNLGRVSDAIS